MAGVGPYSTQFRAERITRRLEQIVHDRSLRNVRVTVTEAEGSSELRVGPRLLMVITQQDARAVGVARPLVAQHYAGDLEAAIRAERLRYAPATLVRSGIYGLLATLALAGAVWLIRRLTRGLHRAIGRGRARRLESVRVLQVEIVSADRLTMFIDRAVGLYATLHARIQDAFYEAGVEIMSPHYKSLRDGNTVAIPEPLRGPGYRAPAFRVEDAAPPREAGHDGVVAPRSG